MPSNPKKQAAFYKPSGSASYKFPRHVQVEDGDSDVAYVGKAYKHSWVHLLKRYCSVIPLVGVIQLQDHLVSKK